jgi:hypothetical protein
VRLRLALQGGQPGLDGSTAHLRAGLREADCTSLDPGALPPGLDKAAVLEALKGGKTLGATAA